MTDTVITQQDRDSLTKLFKLFHQRARDKGFHEMTDALRAESELMRADGAITLSKYVVSVHRGNRLALIGDEIVEAREEIRKGKQPREVYTSVTDETQKAKPEGYIPEMADVFIRFADTIGEEDYYDEGFIEAFLDGLENKAGFNTARSHMNGGKKF